MDFLRSQGGILVQGGSERFAFLMRTGALISLLCIGRAILLAAASLAIVPQDTGENIGMPSIGIVDTIKQEIGDGDGEDNLEEEKGKEEEQSDGLGARERHDDRELEERKV